MKVKQGSIFLGLAVLAATLDTLSLQAQHLGNITFPTSGKAQAQPFFLEGVKDLHSFAFDEAAIAFQKAEKLDPGFVLAYWGEAMSYNHPLWAQQDLDAAKAVLTRLAPDEQTRLSLAKTPKEKAYLEAQYRLFYAPGDKLARDMAYSDAMAAMHTRWPDDDEISTFYALSLLGTVRPGDAGFHRQALAASILLPIFRRNPDHPGAAHFIIHAFDDPDHAILALPAARVYAGIAPDAPHALHMPSHIFLRLGMWDDVRASNIAAYASAEGVVKRLHVAEGGEDFHTLSWLQYANLMLGRFDEANKDLEYAQAALTRNPNSDAVRQGYLTMRARQVLETQQWTDLSLNPDGLKPNGPWIFIAGFSAAHMKNFALAKEAALELGQLREQALKSDTPFNAKAFFIMQKEVEAQVAIEQGNRETALMFAKQASDVELTSIAPSGPPDPIEPAVELYAEMMVHSGNAAKGAFEFNKELMRTPNRTPSVLGLKATGYSQVATYGDTEYGAQDAPPQVHNH